MSATVTHTEADVCNFGVQMELRAHHDWVAIDGKVLRGTLASGDKQSVVFAVSHASRTLLAHAPMQGSQASEIPVVRDLVNALPARGAQLKCCSNESITPL